MSDGRDPPAAAPGAEEKAERGAEAKAERAEAKVERGAGTKAERGAEAKAERAEAKVERGAGTNAEPGAEAKAERGAETNAEPGAAHGAAHGAAPTAGIDELLRALAELSDRVAQTLHTDDAAAARGDAATQVDRLGALVAALERARPADSSALPAMPGLPAMFDLARVGEALRAIAQALRSPGSDAGAQALAELQAMVAPVGRPRDDAAEREHYRQKARAATDEYFREHPHEPFKP